MAGRMPFQSFSGVSMGRPIRHPRLAGVATVYQETAKKSYTNMSAAGFLSASGMDAVTATMHYGMNVRKRTCEDDDYFDDDDDKEEAPKPDDDGDYLPAPDSPGRAENDDDDPLDAFMAGIEVQAQKDKEVSSKHAEKGPSKEQTEQEKKAKLGRTDIEGEDDEESYYRWIEEHPEKSGAADDEEEVDYDEEGNIIRRKKYIDPLPPVDHSTIRYEPFERNFYSEHSQIIQMTSDQAATLRQKLGIKVLGPNPPKPVCSFAHFGFDEKLMQAIAKSEYTQPTPIQAQGIPIALSGRDIIGIAKTGSGKTATYLWPALVHILDQRKLEQGEGPVVLICVPTRELAIQVYNEAKKFGKVFDLTAVCAYGGGSKWEQTKALQEGADIVVCTPGRLIDHVQIKATNLERVTYLVFDEADRMFDMGFETQVRSIANHVRPDRQCLMFSATFKKRIERLARDILNDPIKVVQGEVGEANEDIEQIIEVLPAGPAKWIWLQQHLVRFTTLGKVLIFVTKKQNSDELAANLKAKDFEVALLHGDMFQHERNEVIHKFRHEKLPILVATDVAARGLDIPAIKTVVNYDVARDIDTHVHRVGRTGRAGEKGWAYTLVTDKDKEYAGHLVRNLESVNQAVPEALMDLAMQSNWFRKSRFKGGKGKRPQMGGRGLGYKESTSSSSKPTSSGTGGPMSSGFDATPAGVRASVGNLKGNDRLSAMKSAFSNHYKSTFQAASAETSWDSKQLPFTDPTPEWKHKLDAVKAQLESQPELKPQQRDKKKSRWN